MKENDMNDYQYDRLAQDFGVISGATLKAAIAGETYTLDQLAAMCSTTPDTFALWLAFWQSDEAPTAAPVVSVN